MEFRLLSRGGLVLAAGHLDATADCEACGPGKEWKPATTERSTRIDEDLAMVRLAGICDCCGRALADDR